jgi:hypothetical protein
MGSSEDPKDGKSVAAAVFGAVVIYGVSPVESPIVFRRKANPGLLLTTHTGFPPLLRQPSIPTPETASGWRNRFAIEVYDGY